MSISSASTSSIYASGLKRSRLGAARSTVILQNSPLIQLYMNLGRKQDGEEGMRTEEMDTFPKSNSTPFICKNPLKLTMSHVPNRPIISMQSNIVHLEGKFRERKMNQSFLRKSLRESQLKREEILRNQNHNLRSMKYDIHQMNHAYKIQLALLDKKPVTQKELLLAATALEAIKLTSTGNVMTNNNISRNASIGSVDQSVSTEN